MGDLGSFAGQIQGLICVTALSGMLWLGLMVLIFQRAAERRRRRQLGMEPLPSFFTQGWRWLQGRNQPAPPSTIPLPDLTALTNELPTPDLLEPLIENETPAEEPHFMEDIPLDIDLDTAPPTDTHIGAAMPAPPTLTVKTHGVLFDEVPEDAAEILRLYRDLNGGTIIVDMRGQVFSTINQIKGTKYEGRFMNLVRELVKLSGQAELTEAPPVVSPSKAPPPPPSTTSTDTIGIAGQIEAFLQNRLGFHPEFRGRNIHVHPAADGGVKIEVDGQYFMAVGEVADPAVRVFLQAVIHDWSESQ